MENNKELEKDEKNNKEPIAIRMVFDSPGITYFPDTSDLSKHVYITPDNPQYIYDEDDL